MYLVIDAQRQRFRIITALEHPTENTVCGRGWVGSNFGWDVWDYGGKVYYSCMYMYAVTGLVCEQRGFVATGTALERSV